MKVIETDDIILPLFSEHLKTYVIPVLGNKKKLKSPLKLADGWRFFEDVVILQKNKKTNSFEQKRLKNEKKIKKYIIFQ